MTIDFKALEMEIASVDSDMTAFFELRMHGDTKVIDDDRSMRLEDYSMAELDAGTRSMYGLDQRQLIQAKARCIGRIAGLQTGKEFFGGQA